MEENRYSTYLIRRPKKVLSSNDGFLNKLRFLLGHTVSSLEPPRYQEGLLCRMRPPPSQKSPEIFQFPNTYPANFPNQQNNMLIESNNQLDDGFVTQSETGYALSDDLLEDQLQRKTHYFTENFTQPHEPCHGLVEQVQLGKSIQSDILSSRFSLDSDVSKNVEGNDIDENGMETSQITFLPESAASNIAHHGAESNNRLVEAINQQSDYEPEQPSENTLIEGVEKNTSLKDILDQNSILQRFSTQIADSGLTIQEVRSASELKLERLLQELLGFSDFSAKKCAELMKKLVFPG